MRAKDQLGLDGEAAASVHLERAGMRIVERRWRCAYGELDIVARDAGEIVFVEVKTRRDRDFGFPAEAVVRAKRNRLRRLALKWLAVHPGHPETIRFDVVSVLRPRSGPALIEHVRAAF